MRCSDHRYNWVQCAPIRRIFIINNFLPKKSKIQRYYFISSDKKNEFDNCRQVLINLGLGHATDEDCANVRYVCQCVSARAAHIVSAGIATLIDRMGQNNITVGVDGSVYRYHPHFHDLMKLKIAELVSTSSQVRFRSKYFNRQHFFLI